MTNDARHTLENAIVAYGAAKALHATVEAEFREIAENALAEAWERVMNAITAIDADAPRRS